MSLAEPALLLLALPCLLLWWLVARLQRRALQAVEAGVDRRFRPALTVHSRASLGRHLVLLLNIALLLLLVATRPTMPLDHEEMPRGDRILLLIDASASMYATDVERLPGATPTEAEGEAAERQTNRLDHARALAIDLVRSLEATQFAVASFSGEPTIHLPMTERTDQVVAALQTLEAHSYYRRTGSSLAGALDGVFHFVDPERPGLQVVLIGDGELPYEEAYGEVTAALAEQGIAVHGVTVGSLEGQGRRILDFGDVAADVEEPAVLREYTTYRVDKHYERIARATGGRFEIASSAAAEYLAEAVRAYRPPAAGGENSPRRELGPLFLLAALLGFVFETLVLGRRRKPRDLRLRPRAAGPSCCRCVDRPAAVARRLRRIPLRAGPQSQRESASPRTPCDAFHRPEDRSSAASDSACRRRSRPTTSLVP